ncbi:MAG: tetratricopeptide repeat protein [Phormidesmis sp. RL_2_1]|nr:tetratricopeptide repeat protein [Phormidesmis sp. RL_2_1]
MSDANLLLNKRASLEAKRKQYTSAIEILTRLMAYEPDNAGHYVNRGLMYYNQRQWAQALSDYDHAIELNPRLGKAYSNRANLYASQRQWLAAMADYDEAIDLNPLNIRARLNQAITLREMGEYEEALVCLDIAMFFKPQSATLYAERGRVYHLQGDWNCAITDYSQALDLAADTSSADREQLNQVNRRVLKWMGSFGYTCGEGDGEGDGDIE